MFKRKSHYLLVIVVILSFLLTGCKQNPEDVRIKTESEIKKYASREYGKASLIRTVEKDDGRTCYFMDEEYGFQYYITSYVHGISKIPTAGGVFGYEERVISNYEDEYLNMILNKALNEFKQEENRDCIRFETEDIVRTWENINVFINDKEKVEEGIKKYCKCVKKCDYKKKIE